MATKRDLILWMLLCLIWGSSYLLIKIAVTQMEPLLVVLVRMTVASVIMIAIAPKLGLTFNEFWNAKWICLFSGVIGSVLPFFLIGYGEQTVSSSVAALIMGVMPIVTISLAPMILDNERYNIWIFSAVIAGVLGLYFVAYYDLKSPVALEANHMLAILFAAFCYASQNLVLRKYGGGNRPQVLATGSVVLGALATGLIAPLFLRDWSFGGKSIIAASALGIFATAMAFYIFYTLLPRLGAQKMSLVNFMVPLVGVVLGVLVLHEPLSWNLILASACILLGLFFGLIRARTS